MFESVINILNNFAQRVINTIKAVFIAKGKNATGQTLGTLRSAVEFKTSESAEIDIFGSQVFEFIEKGRPKGAKMPPQGVLLDWMRARGIDESAEFAIRKSISINGIEPTPIIETAFIEIQTDFKQNVSKPLLLAVIDVLSVSIKKGFQFKNK